jgi:hypothetical protein
MTARIVIYGVDGVLLHTRQVILLSAGLTSLATSEIHEVVDFVQTNDHALLVVCSSVEKHLREALLAAVDKIGRRDLRKLVLAKQVVDDSQGNARVLQTPASPLTFISTVQDSIQ